MSYLSLYLDYRYPRGGTGALPQAVERSVLANGGEIRRGTEITRLDPGLNQATDSQGVTYRYKRLVWAADLKTLYRVAQRESLTDKEVVRGIEAREQALVGKTGGDSVFTLYLTVDLDKPYFAQKSSPHFFYTPSLTGLSRVSPDELLNDDPGIPTRLTNDKPRIEDWLGRFLEATTYEISIPALRDGALAPDGKTGLIISSLFDYSLTKHIAAMGWYDEFRELMSARIVRILDASIYPGSQRRGHR